MNNNVITVDLNASPRTISRPLYQYDQGVRLYLRGAGIPALCQVHFSNDRELGAAIPMTCESGFVDVPPQLLRSGRALNFWVCDQTEDEELFTVDAMTIPVVRRPPSVDEAPSAVQDIPSGGGTIHGLEVTETTGDAITEITWHGDLPDSALRYLYYGIANNAWPDLVLDDCGTYIGEYALSGARINLVDVSGLENVERIGQFGLSFDPGSSAVPISLPKYTGRNKAGQPGASVFRSTAATAPTTYNLPVLEVIPQYAWYGYRVSNISITMGSVGHAVQSSETQPFGNTGSASGVVTIYTTGALLDTLKTAVLNGAGSSLQFVFKAAEATTYGGVSYAAGDTILTSTP